MAQGSISERLRYSIGLGLVCNANLQRARKYSVLNSTGVTTGTTTLIVWGKLFRRSLPSPRPCKRYERRAIGFACISLTMYVLVRSTTRSRGCAIRTGFSNGWLRRLTFISSKRSPTCSARLCREKTASGRPCVYVSRFGMSSGRVEVHFRTHAVGGEGYRDEGYGGLCESTPGRRRRESCAGDQDST